MNRLSGLSHPLLLGFDEIERLVERLGKSTGDGYPPYNIVRRPTTDGGAEVIRITLAVAGFDADDLEVVTEGNQLVVRGRQADEGPRGYLHKGIATRQFQKAFVLAEGIEVLGAELKDGLLSIDLARPRPEMQVRRIAITGGV
jgi:HSP20 family molecular chaperone IbpA